MVLAGWKNIAAFLNIVLICLPSYLHVCVNEAQNLHNSAADCSLYWEDPRLVFLLEPTILTEAFCEILAPRPPQENTGMVSEIKP
jgi:hypothetical protein